MCWAKQDPAVETGSVLESGHLGDHRPAISIGARVPIAVFQNAVSGKPSYGFNTLQSFLVVADQHSAGPALAQRQRTFRGAVEPIMSTLPSFHVSDGNDLLRCVPAGQKFRSEEH